MICAPHYETIPPGAGADNPKDPGGVRILVQLGSIRFLSSAAGKRPIETPTETQAMTATAIASKILWSAQQEAAFEFVRTGEGSAILVAVAGAGKTTTLVQICKIISQMMGSWGRPQTARFLAFNKPVADEIGGKLKSAGVGPHITSSTFHSAGFQAWRKVAPNVKVEQRSGEKVNGIMDKLEVPAEFQGFVRQLVSMAKQRAVGVLEPSREDSTWYSIVQHFDLDEKLSESAKGSGLDLETLVKQGISWARKVLVQSVKMDMELIDFDDMIYAPLIHNANMFQTDWVLVDEAQDTNPARRALAKKMLKPGGRLIAVGDPHQGIYGFTGADNDAMEIIKREFDATTLLLTVTYRCPKAVVSLARTWVSHIEAHETAPEGIVRTVMDADFRKEWTGLVSGDSVLCRNTKPLVETAFALIRQQIPCHVEGKDIGAGLMQLVRKWKTATTIGALRERLEDHLQKEVQRLLAKGQEDKAERLTDRVETLFVLMETLSDDDSTTSLQEIVNRLFADTKAGEKPRGVTLSTVHKSKGREWHRVYLLGRNAYMPSKFARQAWQMEQEKNLMYVAVTRAKSELVEVMV